MADERLNRRRFLGTTATVVGGSAVVGVGRLRAATGSPTLQEEWWCRKPRRSEFEASLISRAWQDEEFKAALKKNPKPLMQRALGIEIPADVTVRVVEEDPRTVYLVLPAPPPAMDEKELVREDLWALAAGVGKKTACGIPSTVMMPAWFFTVDFMARSRDAERIRGYGSLER